MRKFRLQDITSWLEIFPEDQYMPVRVNKEQVVIHHTVSGDNVDGDIRWWISTKDRIATPFLISREGVLNQTFSSSMWAHHLGIKGSVFKKYGLPNINTFLNMSSIAIEIDSWGGLNEKNGKYYSYTCIEIPRENVIVYDRDYRGFRAFERYTDKQIETLQSLIVYLCRTYDISMDYDPRIWFLNKDALKGKNGIFSHTSYREDKSDCHPQPELIKMLEGLSKLTEEELDYIWKK